MSQVTLETDIQYIRDQLKYADHYQSDDRFNTALFALSRIEQKLKEYNAKINNEENIPTDPYAIKIDNDYLDSNRNKYTEYKKYDK